MLERIKQYSKTGYLLKVATVLLILNITFFFFYYRALSLPFTLVTALIIISVNVNFVLLLYVIRNTFLRSLIALAYVAVFLYALINYAYYEVFQTFLRVNLQQAKSVNLPLLAMLKDFYFFIPSYIYALFAVIVAAFTALPLAYARKMRKQIFNDESNMNRFNFIITKIRIRKSRVALIILTLVALNASLVFFLRYYENSALAGDKGSAQVSTDLGPMGMLVDEASGGVAKNDAKTAERLQAELKQKSALELALEKEGVLRSFSATTSPIVFQSASSTGQKFNVLIYQLESVSAWALKLNPTPMPFLASLMKTETTVDHFFPNSCMTINAEFSSLCSFYTDSYGPVSDLYSNNDFYCLPQILKEKYGYATTYNHANSSEFWNRTTLGPRWGFDKMNFTPYYDTREFDAKVVASVVDGMAEAKKPTFNYVIGFSSHSPHNKKFLDFYNKNGAKIVPFKGELTGVVTDVKAEDETLRNYLGFLGAIDQSIKTMFDELKAKNLLDKTVVVLYGDHKFYGFRGVEDADQFMNYHEVPFVMHIPGYSGNLGAVASHIDVAPTILNILEGAGFAQPQKFLGQSLIAAHQPMAVNKCLGQAYFYNQSAIFKRDIIADKNYAFHYFDNQVANQYDARAQALTGLLDASDMALTQNQLGKDASILTTGIIEAPVATTTASTTKREVKGVKLKIDKITDSDGDGLSNLRESAVGTDKNNPDTDGDGYTDGEEVRNGYNPLGPGKLKANGAAADAVVNEDAGSLE